MSKKKTTKSPFQKSSCLCTPQKAAAATAEGRGDMWAGTSNVEFLDEYAWFRGNSEGATHQVGRKKPNPTGLYDMSGNVREWVSDWYSEMYYHESPPHNPSGAAKGNDRLLRGGSWDEHPRYMRLSYRSRLNPDFNNSRNGFRCAFSPAG